LRGCLALVLAGSIVMGAGAVYALERFRHTHSASSSPNVLDFGPLHIGSPCAHLLAAHPTAHCKFAYYLVVKINDSPLWSMELPIAAPPAVSSQ
jgi:hypothetical protein